MKSIEVLLFVTFMVIVIALTIRLYQESAHIESYSYDDLRRTRYEELKSTGVKVLNVPFVKQKPWYCSEASASMVLRYYGFNVSQDDVHNAGYENFETMLPFLRRYLKCKYAVLSPEDLRAEIDSGRPIIIRIVVGTYLHTIVVVGYHGDYFYVHDPAIGPYIKVSEKKLLDSWRLNNCKAIVLLKS